MAIGRRTVASKTRAITLAHAGEELVDAVGEAAAFLLAVVDMRGS